VLFVSIVKFGFFYIQEDTRDKIAELRELCMRKKDKCLLGLFKNYEWLLNLKFLVENLYPKNLKQWYGILILENYQDKEIVILAII
jgi:hypothetical protein